MAKSFELQMKEFENMTAERSELLFKKVCFDLSNSIIMDTAVLSGAARGNWQPDINSIQNNVLEIEDKSGNATVAKVASKTNNLRLGQYFTLTNNLPYILRLEYGWSRTKSPNGMVGINVMRFQNFVNQANRDIE